MDQAKIEELRNYFDGVTLPKAAIRLGPGAMISNLPLFIKTQFNIVRSDSGSAVRQPAYDRLVALREILSGKKILKVF